MSAKLTSGKSRDNSRVSDVRPPNKGNKGRKMNEEDLKRAVKPQAFEPSRIHLSNGATFDIPHPDWVSVGPRTTAILVGESHQIISNIHVNFVEPLVKAG